jgi:serine protease Do
VLAVLFSCTARAADNQETVQEAAEPESCRTPIAQIYERTSEAVVLVSTRTINPYRLTDRVQRAIGSGFIFDREGLLLTNSHVVYGAQSITVTLDDGSTTKAELVGADPIFDLAVLRISKPAQGTLPVIKLGDSDLINVGDDVIAIGNPFGLDQTLTRGVVSALNRVLPESPLALPRAMIQTDTPINPGNSGGPLLNRCGDAIGINSEIIEEARGISFAIPINLVKAVLPMLIGKGHVVRPWLGFHGQLIDADLAEVLSIPVVPGMLVEVVEPDSPAAKAKIQGGDLDVSIAGKEFLVGGDIVTQINGIRIEKPDDLAKAMKSLTVGSRVALELYRNGKTVRVSYRLPERPILPGDVEN